jgi:hypothetical protein
MAQAAAEDHRLFASYIQQYALKKSLSWDEVAARLQIGREQLAKLALCNRPQPGLFSGDMMQVADYVGMERPLLKAFVAEVEGREVTATNQMTTQSKGSSFLSLGRRKESILAGLFKRRSWTVGVVVLLLLVVGAFAFAQPQSAAAATLVVYEGQARVVSAGARNGSQEVSVATGEVLTVRTGDQIFLTAASTAHLLLIDGSIIELAAGTEINVDELVIDEATYRVHLRLLGGRTVSRVVSVLGVGDRFEISTPSSTASVRGTIFTVAYISAGETFISCDEGQVEVTLEGQTSQLVIAGMEVTAVAGRPLVVKPQIAPQDATPAATPTNVPSPTAVETDEAEVAEPEELVEAEAAENEAVYEELSNKPEDIPGHNGIVVPPGPPEQVPGHTPDDPPGVGEPPQGEGEVPANENSSGGNGPPEQVPGNTPDEIPGNGAPPSGGGEPPGGGPPDQVPGNTPDETPGNGEPPPGGGEPPGGGSGNNGNNGGGNPPGGGNNNSGG